MLTPFPGTRLPTRLEAEGRLLTLMREVYSQEQLTKGKRRYVDLVKPLASVTKLPFA